MAKCDQKFTISYTKFKICFSYMYTQICFCPENVTRCKCFEWNRPIRFKPLNCSFWLAASQPEVWLKKNNYCVNISKANPAEISSCGHLKGTLSSQSKETFHRAWNRCPSLRWTQWLKITGSFMQQHWVRPLIFSNWANLKLALRFHALLIVTSTVSLSPLMLSLIQLSALTVPFEFVILFAYE